MFDQKYSGNKKVGVEVVSRRYLGDYQTCQYLEDSNLLDQAILEPRLNYRIFKGVPVFRFFKSLVGCGVVVNCNHEDPSDT